MSLLIPILTRGPKGSPVGHIHSIAYQHNGMGGLGFYSVEFDCKEGSQTRLMHAIVTFDDDGKNLEAYVTSKNPSEDWRGTDCFGPALREVCQAAKWPHEIDKRNV